MDITSNAVRLFKDEMSGINTFYCREDVEDALHELKEATPDAAPSRRQELIRLCTWIGGPSGEQILQDPELIRQIPSRQEQNRRLYQAFHSLYAKLPTAVSYMRRIVDRLVPGYSNLPLRVAILRQFIRGAGTDCKTFPLVQIEARILKQLSPEEQSFCQHLSAEDRITFLADHADDSLFEAKPASSPLDEEAIQSIEKGVLDKLASKNLRDKKNNPVSYSSLCQIYQDPNSNFTGSLRQIFYLTRNGSWAPAYEIYKTDIRDARRRSLRTTGADIPEILTICQNLAEGKFLTNNGRTRAYLYYFAMMFDMDFNPDKDTTGKTVPQKDFEDDLFHDYYSDHLLRFLQTSTSDQEKEPTGEGINYKNYAEMVYLYYLYRKDLPLTPGQRIDQAEKTISDIFGKAKKDPARPPHMNQYTSAYRDNVISSMLKLPECELPSYILKNFQIIPDERFIVHIGVAAEERRAHALTMEILEKLKSYYFYSFEGIDDDLIKLKETWDNFGDRLKEEKNWIQKKDDSFAQALKAAYPEDTAFINIVDRLEKRISTAFSWTKGEDMGDTVPRRVTRNQLVSAFALMYQASIYEINGLDTFPDIYFNFKKEIDPYLTASRFQTFSEKNLLDLYLLLSIYHYLICNGKE
ncbi:MAG: hypothetical protein IKE58_04180 [Blautia sp.]|nr:hypothetical protein [Blautia sp.]